MPDDTNRPVRTVPLTPDKKHWRADFQYSAGDFDPNKPVRPYSYFGTGETEAEAIADLHRREAADTWSPVNGE